MPHTKLHAAPVLPPKSLTPSPAELRGMLLDGAIKFARQGRDALAAKDYEGMFKGFTRTREILVELSTTMRRDVGDPTLVDRTQALYTFMMTRLLDASHDKDVAPADEVIKLIEYDRETWALLMDQPASEQRPGPGRYHPQPNAQATPTTPFTAPG